MLNFFPFLFSFASKVGEQEEKLAEGITLYALSTTATSKRTILSDLITVRFDSHCYYYYFVSCRMLQLKIKLLIYYKHIMGSHY